MSLTTLYTFGSVFLVSIISVIGVFFMSMREEALRRRIPLLISLAVGALLGDVFIHLLPELFEEIGNRALAVSSYVLAGIVVFFLLEKGLHWHHHGEDSHAPHPVGKLVLISDGLHNFLDGIIIAGSFLLSVPAGIATTVAVILHEIPQEVGDFAVLLHAGYSRKRALVLNGISALMAFIGATIVLGGVIPETLGGVAIPALAAGGFIYIAMSDLVPELHKADNHSKPFGQFGMLLIGVAAMFALTFLE